MMIMDTLCGKRLDSLVQVFLKGQWILELSYGSLKSRMGVVGILGPWREEVWEEEKRRQALEKELVRTLLLNPCETGRSVLSVVVWVEVPRGRWWDVLVCAQAEHSLSKSITLLFIEDHPNLLVARVTVHCSYNVPQGVAVGSVATLVLLG